MGVWVGGQAHVHAPCPLAPLAPLRLPPPPPRSSSAPPPLCVQGEEFDTDAENLSAWQDCFQQPHYWAADLGPALLLGLSTRWER